MAFLTKAANRGSIATGYDIENSLKFESDNAEYLYYTPSTQTDYERMAFSVWLKRTELSTSQRIAEFGNGTSNTSNLRIGFDTSDRLFCYGNSIIWRQTNQVFRDTTAWYHLFFLFDTTTPGGISNNRIRIWVNGEMIPHTDFGVINNPGSGAAMGFNNALQQSIGAQREGGPTAYFNGYMAQVYGSGGTPPVVTDFGEFEENTGIWKPIDISELTPPDTQGFNLDFSDASNLGNDISTRNNNFTLQNITSADQATDTPTNNFCTWNVNYNYTSSVGNPTITEGATKTAEGTGGWAQAKATMGVTSGKWYWEYKMGGYISWMGVQDDTASQTELAGQYTLFLYNGDTTVEINDTGSLRDDTVLSYTFSTSNIYAVALNMDDNEISYYQNGSIIGSAISLDGLADRLLLPYIGTNSSTNETNFGGYTTISISTPASDANGYGTFEYAPPSGYYAICTKNLAEYG